MKNRFNVTGVSGRSLGPASKSSLPITNSPEGTKIIWPPSELEKSGKTPRSMTYSGVSGAPGAELGRGGGMAAAFAVPARNGADAGTTPGLAIWSASSR